jgi:phosphoglycolate phosphatase
MSRFGLLVFDLDGTLADTQYDLAASVNQTRVHYGLPSADIAVIRSYVGNGIAQLLTLALPNVPGEKLPEAVMFFMKHYDEHLLDTTKLFPGIEEVLNGARGVKKAVLTNKSEVFSRKILSGLGIINLFDVVWGGDTGPYRKPSPEPLLNIIGRLRAETKSTLMIGDSSNDILSARGAGAVSCATGWGYTEKEELLGFKPDYFAASPGELPALL